MRKSRKPWKGCTTCWESSPSYSADRFRLECQVRLRPGLQPMANIRNITVRGARQHNLKRDKCRDPTESLTVITGLSGSGKSSLAFDTIYAEGQRRYLESLSAYARQFLDRLEPPDVDSIEGLSPAILSNRRPLPGVLVPQSGQLPKFTTTCAFCFFHGDPALLRVRQTHLEADAGSDRSGI